MHKFIIAFCSLAIFASCSDTKTQGNLEISGSVKGLKKGKLYIQRVQDTTLVALDTIILNGKSTFESTIQLDSPEMLYLFLDRGVSNSIDNNLLFFAEPGKMTIDTDLEFFLGKAKITGSKNQELYEQYKAIISQFNDQQLELMKDELMAFKNKTSVSPENEKKQDAILKRRYLYAANFALTNADHEVAPYIALTDIYDMNLKYLDTIQKAMSPQVSKSKYGKKLNEFLAERKKKEQK
ncbi:DUF4369 domain-containing protein [Flavobacterium humi]|uniref:DUF4369 domain-containing protein n=1 Tax=Flavobacterium humi TaxID=2562683 RepID=A0A4Z0L661_9FLAO|nr:DUF4369 domain-containing protein [Flavobacterium humi]TGD57190.1 DUF4369 domain-containing protein [Flavobacterium humi]